MKGLHNPAVLWFIAGFVLFLLEFMVPGLVLFFFAIGAWIVSILSFFLNISLDTQLYVFIGSSFLSILLFRKCIKKRLWVKNHVNEIQHEFIGKTAKAQSVIHPGHHGKVELRGTVWDAKSEDHIQKGENVIIIGNESILLIVKSSTTTL